MKNKDLNNYLNIKRLYFDLVKLIFIISLFLRKGAYKYTLYICKDYQDEIFN